MTQSQRFPSQRPIAENRCAAFFVSTRPTVLATDPRDRASDRCSVCLGRIVEQLMRQIMQYDGEFRREEATSVVSSNVKH
jgi:hypothetical protein